MAKVSASYEERLSAARAENSLKIQQGKILSTLSKTSIQNINQHNGGEFVINIIKLYANELPPTVTTTNTLCSDNPRNFRF